MGFRINTNIGAMNAHRNAVQTNLNLDNSLQKLSSGLRVNKAADDASGMSIANSLRSQANGLGQAIVNANDAIGVTQTADGAFDEYTKIIDIIRTKSIQAASDGQTLDTRTKIQSDIDRLQEEAQNIAATTSFNGQTLLNGAFQNKSFHIGAYAGETVKLSIGDASVDQVAEFALAEATGGFGSLSAGNAAGSSAQIAVSVVNADGSTATVNSTASFLANTAYTAIEITQKTVDAFNRAAQIAGADVRASIVEASTSTTTTAQYSIRFDSSGDLTAMSISETLNDNGQAIGVSAAVSANLNNNFSTLDVTTRREAEKAIIISDYALKDIDATRADIGSVQNQLESTIRNISVTQVNVAAAESQIRDVDFASESSQFAKFNILAQSGSYAMSQANSVQQNVMRLLQ